MNASFCWQCSWYQPNPREIKRRTNEIKAIVEIKIAQEGVAQTSFAIKGHLNTNTTLQPKEFAGMLYDKEIRAHQTVQN